MRSSIWLVRSQSNKQPPVIYGYVFPNCRLSSTSCPWKHCKDRSIYSRITPAIQRPHSLKRKYAPAFLWNIYFVCFGTLISGQVSDMVKDTDWLLMCRFIKTVFSSDIASSWLKSVHWPHKAQLILTKEEKLRWHILNLEHMLRK